ncbi:CDP-alcohol phosphatidyltransferase family protein [uncultured Thiothrix sp.]|uniref:CDP-alcohol phosphatidyltransferase family protein n=1 Tax=uncultured Thiothrix sp. TaxID=223185 RepID=UPI002632F18B|nr:CDP-alcohol phosphatidyltransferase family protein [uncultured Thiothrix sp.]
MNNNQRRPLKVRSLSIFQTLARKLSQTALTPNQISVFSIVFAALAAACLGMLAQAGSNAWFLLVAVFIQLRLLCNLLDGMVAVEGGKSTKSGELFNDIPDRIADPLILVSAGYATQLPWGMELGWAAGLLAVLTAYIRSLAVSIGAPADFRGPMAKQQRMAVLTLACVLSLFESLFWAEHWLLFYTLVLIVLGAIWTAVRRTVAAYRYLEAA